MVQRGRKDGGDRDPVGTYSTGRAEEIGTQWAHI